MVECILTRLLRSRFRLYSCSTPFFLSAVIARQLSDGSYRIGLFFLEVLEIQRFDKLGQGQFPGFLLSIGEAAELLRIQPKFSGHPDVGMGELITLPRVDSPLVLFRCLFFFAMDHLLTENGPRSPKAPRSCEVAPV